jgi:hypothetical protein
MSLTRMSSRPPPLHAREKPLHLIGLQMIGLHGDAAPAGGRSRARRSDRWSRAVLPVAGWPATLRPEQ